MDRSISHYLGAELARGRLMLMSGAGFSADARDLDGRPIPTGDELAAELWELCFPGETRDRSDLQDLFQHALTRRREALTRLLRRRLTVDPATLPDWYERWFSLPWRRAYTLNVDDIERAAGRRFRLPRGIAMVSALRDSTARSAPSPAGDVRPLEIVHLNGLIDDAPDGITFSTTQYGMRLAQHEPWYERLVSDLATRPFLFVGTRLDESPLWQHMELRGRRDGGSGAGVAERPRSFVVTPQLERARRSLLEEFNIEWVPASARDFAIEALGALPGWPR